MKKQGCDLGEMIDWIVKNEPVSNDPKEIEQIFTVQVTSRACHVPLEKVAHAVLDLKMKRIRQDAGAYLS